VLSGGVGPRYVVVSGPAASGKAVVAHAIADELGWPLIAKDTHLYWHIGLLWGLCASIGTLHSSHVDDPDTRHRWTMLQSLLREAGEASSWRRR
jgi:cytidylate kinase